MSFASMSQLSVSPNRSTYHHVNSPTSTISDDDDSNHSEPNDLRTSQKSRHHGFGGYSSFYSPPQSHSTGNGSGGGSGGGHSSHPQPQYVATNECRLIDYRGARIAAFLAANRQGEYLLCLPQAFELFLKHLVGGLHTVYTKLKRLDIVPIVCNVEQVRILRGLGAIQPGVNRCKLLSTHDFDVLYKDCTTARPGRPPKRSSGIPSPEPGSYGTSTPINANQQPSNNLLPLLGFTNSKKIRYSDDCDYSTENLDLKQLSSGNGNLSTPVSSAATAAAMLAANGYSAAFPFLQHLSAAANSMPSSQQQQQQLVAAAAALGLPALPSRFGTNSPPPGVHPQSNQYQSSATPANNAATPESSDFNPTAAYLWLLSQQQQHLPNAAAAAAALNLSSRSVAATNFMNGTSPTNLGNGVNCSGNGLSPVTNTHTNKNSINVESGLAEKSASVTKEKNSQKSQQLTTNHDEHKTSNGVSQNGNKASNNNGHVSRKRNKDDEEDDEEDSTDEDDVESNNSSNHSENPVSSSGFNGTGIINSSNANNSIISGRNFLESVTSMRNSSTASPIGGTVAQSQSEHCLETLLRNIEGLLAIAAHNARQQQTQLQLQKAEMRSEYTTQLDREREMREHVEKQYHEEQKIRIIYQKRFKKERKLRRKLEQELQQHSQQSQQSASINLSSSMSSGSKSQNTVVSSVPVNNLTPVSNNTKSPVSSLPPTPPPHTASSDEAE